MKALIAAGGRGTRLRPITFTRNKHLIPIANKSMIQYAVEKLALAGIKEIIISVNEGDTELQKIVGDGSQYNVRLTYLEQKGGALGVAHVVKNAQPLLGSEPFIFYLGDNIILNDISSFRTKFEEEGLNCLLALSKVKDPRRFGVPLIIDGKIVRVDEKPEHPQSEFAVAGIYIYDHNVFEAFDHIIPSQRGELEISDVHTYLIEQGYSVGYEEITGWWKDTGKPEDLLEGNQLVLSQYKDSDIQGTLEEGIITQGNVIIGQGSSIQGRAHIRGPVIIGKNTIIKDAYIGPYTSIGDNVQIKDVEIEHSIIMDGTKIEVKQRIVDSIIGHNAVITSIHETLPGGHKLVIGDNSLVEI